MGCCANEEEEEEEEEDDDDDDDDDDDNSAGLRTAISSEFVTILKDSFEDSVHMAATLMILLCNLVSFHLSTY
jgi:hypothetical protein